MNDILPEVSGTWRYLESIVQEIVRSYGYSEIRLPLLEHTDLFKRSIGEVTDIVEKEMYTFLDRNGESLTLRPEATAGMVRAGMTNGLFHNQKQKLWTSGPMFRYEKPQAGRYRQFYQFDVEAVGYDGPDADAELIIMSARMWQRLGISKIRLEINSLGTPEARVRYREALVEYFSGVKMRWMRIVFAASSRIRSESSIVRIRICRRLLKLRPSCWIFWMKSLPSTTMV